MPSTVLRKAITDQRPDGPMDGWMDGRTDTPSYRDATAHLKTGFFRDFKASVTNGRTDGWTDGRMDGRKDGRTDSRMNGRTDTPSYRDAKTHLKTKGLHDNIQFDVKSKWLKLQNCDDARSYIHVFLID